MKNLLHVIKNSFLALLLVSGAHAKSVARVASVKGDVFAISKDVTFKVSEGDYFDDFTEILTEESGQISFVDYYDHTFHLSSSGHIKIMNKILELRSGHVWIQSKSRDKNFSIQTSNSDTTYADSEFIVSYDSNVGKTQLMVVNGTVNFSNILESHVKYTVDAGQFSFVDQKYDDGLPRNPTRTGFKSFKTVMNFFNGIQATDKGFMDVMETQLSEVDEKMVKQNGTRSIASVPEGPTSGKGNAIILTRDQKKKGTGKILFISSVKKEEASRLPASSQISKSYFSMIDKKQPVKKKKSVGKVKYTGKKTSVRVFGFSDLEEVKPSFPENSKAFEKEVKQPATVKSIVARKKSVTRTKRKPANDMTGDAAYQGYDQRAFEKSLNQEYNNQKKHPEEVNELIDELQNYQEDYTKQY